MASNNGVCPSPPPNTVGTTTPEAVSASELSHIPWGRPLLSSISKTLDDNEIPNLLWGDMALYLHGVPTVVNVNRVAYVSNIRTTPSSYPILKLGKPSLFWQNMAFNYATEFLCHQLLTVNICLELMAGRILRLTSHFRILALQFCYGGNPIS
jgi:hypothetical protein